MSTELINRPREGYQLTGFYGGDARGYCLQITSDHGYVQVTREGAALLAADILRYFLEVPGPAEAQATPNLPVGEGVWSLTPAKADALIQEFIDLGEQMKRLKDRRAKIAKQFAPGRTEGDRLALYVAGRGYSSRFDAALLRRYVPAATLDLCRVTTYKNGSVRVVPKSKPRPKKEKRA